MNIRGIDADVVMLGTFGAWRLGTIQARALPFARALSAVGIRTAIVTTPWDAPLEAGVIDIVHGVPVINTSSVSVIQPYRAVREQIAWVRRLNPGIVHVFKPKGFGGLTARALRSSMPVVVDSDDWEGDGGWNDVADYSWPQQRVFQYQEQDLLRNGVRITAASTLLADRARSIRSDRPDTVHLIENGIGPDRAFALNAARTNPPSRQDPPVVVLYSRFAEFEDNWLGRFCGALAQTFPRPIIVRVIGRDRIAADPPRQVGSVIVDILGYVASADVPPLLGSATVGVYPYQDSLITRSKQSVKLLELMAAGCPVIASDVGDVARTLGAGGQVLRSVDPAEFALEVARLLSSPGRLDEMSQTAMSRVALLFNISSLAARLNRVYGLAGLR